MESHKEWFYHMYYSATTTMPQQTRRTRRVVCFWEEENLLSPSATAAAPTDDHAPLNTTIQQSPASANVGTEVMDRDETKVSYFWAPLTTRSFGSDLMFDDIAGNPRVYR